MTEMIHVTEGEDIGSLLKNQLPQYEIINFGSRSMGLFDQLELYKSLIKKYNVDIVILYITENDFENNFGNPKMLMFLTSQNFL